MTKWNRWFAEYFFFVKKKEWKQVSKCFKKLQTPKKKEMEITHFLKRTRTWSTRDDLHLFCTWKKKGCHHHHFHNLLKNIFVLFKKRKVFHHFFNHYPFHFFLNAKKKEVVFEGVLTLLFFSTALSYTVSFFLALLYLKSHRCHPASFFLYRIRILPIKQKNDWTLFLFSDQLMKQRAHS